MQQKRLVSFLFGFVFLFVLAKSQNRNEFWSKLGVTKKINEKWSVGIDLQYRSQANYRANNHYNIFEYSLTRSVRTAIYYKLPQEWQLIASPFIYFEAKDIDNQFNLLTTHEFRTVWGVSKGFQETKIKNKNRFLYETRFFEWNKANQSFQHRYRLQNTITFPLIHLTENAKCNVFLMNELFLKTQKRNTLFDQNRIFAAIQYQYKGMDILSGYLHVFQRGSSQMFQRRVWLTTLSFSLP